MVYFFAFATTGNPKIENSPESFAPSAPVYYDFLFLRILFEASYIFSLSAAGNYYLGVRSVPVPVPAVWSSSSMFSVMCTSYTSWSWSSACSAGVSCSGKLAYSGWAASPMPIPTPKPSASAASASKSASASYYSCAASDTAISWARAYSCWDWDCCY